MTIPGGLISLLNAAGAAGEAPTFIAYDVALQTTDRTTHSITFSSVSPSSGDLLVLIVGTDGANSVAVAPSGYTQHFLWSAADFYTVYWKISDGTETSATLSSGSVGTSIFYALQFRGTNQTTPIEGSTEADGLGSTVVDPALHTAGSSQKYMWLSFFEVRNGSLGALPTASPSGYSTLVVNNTGSGTAHYASGFSYKALSEPASSEDPGAYTTTVDWAWRALTIAIQPP